jgi:hypothetical protein
VLGEHSERFIVKEKRHRSRERNKVHTLVEAQKQRDLRVRSAQAIDSESEPEILDVL